jgi:hypothetical protein
LKKINNSSQQAGACHANPGEVHLILKNSGVIGTVRTSQNVSKNYRAEMKLEAIIFIVPFLINFILLYARKKTWARSKFKWLILIISFVIGFVAFQNPDYFDLPISRQASWSIMTPLMFSILDFLIMHLSYSIQNRDLYLWLRGSTEIDDSKFSGGKHVKGSDRIFSLILLFSVIFLPFAGMLIFK